MALLSMSAAQSVSTVAALQISASHLDLVRRLLRAALGATAVTLMCSYVFQNQFAHRIVLPLEVQGSPLLINPLRATNTLQRGEWVAYSLYGQVTYGQILAFGGDTVTAHATAIVVNGVAYRRPTPAMPSEGEMVVPEQSYLIWPQGLNPRWAHMARNVEIAYYGVVKRESIVGPAYHRWLWRKQELPPLATVKDWTPSLSKP